MIKEKRKEIHDLVDQIIDLIDEKDCNIRTNLSPVESTLHVEDYITPKLSNLKKMNDEVVFILNNYY